MYKVKKSKISIFLFALLLLTPLRMMVLILIPLLCLMLINIYKLKNTYLFCLLFFIFLLSALYNLILGNTFFPNILLTALISMPLLLLFSSNSDFNSERAVAFSFTFLKYAQTLLIIIDVIGFVTRFFIFKTADEFGWAYGRHFKYVSGLAMLNTYFFLYHLSKLLDKNKRDCQNYILSVFFFISLFSCFSGLALMCLLITLFVFFITKFNIKYFIIWTAIICFFSVAILRLDTKNNMLEYNIHNIELISGKNNENYENARKIIMIQNYVNLIKMKMSYSLIGIGPGGYNSRVAFLLNTDSNNIFTRVFGHQMPPFHKSDVYSLWSKTFLDFDAHNDGARNRPFSAFISISAEMGIIFSILLFSFWVKKIVTYYKGSKNNASYVFLFLINVFMLLNFVLEQWFECSEFLVFLILNYIVLTLEKYDTKDNSLLLVWGKSDAGKTKEIY